MSFAQRWRRAPGATNAVLVAAVLAAAGTAVVTNTAATASATVSAQADADTQCLPEPRTAQEYTQTFSDLTGIWDGADVASSVTLPDGARLWIFGDTILGTTDKTTGTRSNASMIHNSMLIQRGGCFTSVGGNREVIPRVGDEFSWPSHAWIQDDTVWVTSTRVRAKSTTEWTEGAVELIRFTYANATLTLNDRELLDTQGPFGRRVNWGSAVTDPCPTTTQCQWVYMYGTASLNKPLIFGKELYLARAPRTDPTDQAAWQYSTGPGEWTDSPEDAAVLHPAEGGVSTVLSAHLVNNKWLLVTKQDEFLGRNIITMTADNPAGPYTIRTVADSPSTEDTWTYTALGHPDIDAPNRTLMVSVCRNTGNAQRAFTQGRLYRPQFVTVPVDGLTG